MKLDENTLVDYLKIFAQTGISPLSPSVRREPSTVPPVTEEEMLAAEAALGFALPPLLRRLYLEVSDGDFAFFLPLSKERYRDYFPNSLVVWSVSMPSAMQGEIDAPWNDAAEEEGPTLWPEKVLVIGDYGCNMYCCLDFSKPDCPVLTDTEGILTLEAPSLHEYLEAWLVRKKTPWLD